jgi:hypothetical protein
MIPPGFDGLREVVLGDCVLRAQEREENRRSDSRYCATSQMATSIMGDFTQGDALTDSRLPSTYMSPAGAFDQRLLRLPLLSGNESGAIHLKLFNGRGIENLANFSGELGG